MKRKTFHTIVSIKPSGELGINTSLSDSNIIQLFSENQLRDMKTNSLKHYFSKLILKRLGHLAILKCSILFFLSSSFAFAKSSFFYTLSYGTYDFSIKQQDLNSNKAQLNSSKGKSFKGEISYRSSKKVSYDLELESIKLKLSPPLDRPLDSMEISIKNYSLGVSLYSKFLKTSFKILSEQIFYINNETASLQLKSSRTFFGGMELNLLAKINGPYGLLLSSGYYLYMTGDDFLNDEIKKGNLYKLKGAFLYTSKDFLFETFLSGGLKTIKSDLNEVDNLNLKMGLSFKF